LLFLMSIIYVGSGDFFRKLSHCSSAQALKHSHKNNPQKGILEYSTNSSKEETKLFESFLILFLKNYKYNIANISNGSLYYHWQKQKKLISINIGFLISFKIYQNFINGVCTPIKITDVMYTPRKTKTKTKNQKLGKITKNKK
jgi:hypothetical protein